MKSTAAITVRYWVGEKNLTDVEEFRKELADGYTVSLVRSRPGGLGGGLYQLSVEFLSQLTVAEVVRVLLEGAAYDLIKSGADAFFIRPFVDAYRRFRDRNKNERVDIDHIRLIFQDLTVNVERIPNTDILAELEHILLTLARHFETIVQGSEKSQQTSRERLFEVHIPIFEDTSADRVCRFRTLLSADETLDVKAISSADYFKWWGLEYDYFRSEVYDVEHKSIVNERFCEEREYWERQKQRRK